MNNILTRWRKERENERKHRVALCLQTYICAEQFQPAIVILTHFAEQANVHGLLTGNVATPILSS